MNRSLLSLLVPLALFSALSGCSVITREAGEPLQGCAVQPELAPRDYGEAMQRLGPPHTLSRLGDHVVFLYEYVSSEEKQLGLGSDADWFEWFKLSLGDAEAHKQIHLLLFDENGALVTERCLDHDGKLGNAAGVQFIIAVKSMVDASHLENTIGPHDWGQAMLKPLPQLLNQQSSLEWGAEGVEILGTPSSIGQHTLEMR